MERGRAPSSPKAPRSESRGPATPASAASKGAAQELEEITFAHIQNSVLEVFDRQISTAGLSKAQREAVNEGLRRASKQVTTSLQVGSILKP